MRLESFLHPNYLLSPDRQPATIAQAHPNSMKMASSTDPTGQRHWRLLVMVVVVLVLALFAIALWSEREDAQTLPAEQMEGAEEGFDGPL